METLTIKMLDRDEEAAIWPEATPEERLNSTAMMLLAEYIEDFNVIFRIFFTTDNEAGTITYRTEQEPEALRMLRQTLGWVPELVTVESTI
jgi:hypothetical protein